MPTTILGETMDLWIPEVKFRHIRYVKDGQFIKYTKKIGNTKLLSEFFKKRKIYEAYYSTSQYLNPHKIKQRNTENEYSTIYMKTDIFFDIDFAPISKRNLNRAKEESLKVLDYIKDKGWRIKYIAFSGSKGFHISVKDPINYEGTPKEREFKAIEMRKKWLNEIKDEGITIDEGVFTDTRRIVRIPGTFNEKTGYLCRLLDRRELEKEIGEILRNTKRDLTLPIKRTIRSILQKKRTPSTKEEYNLFLRSNVSGTKAQVFIAYMGERDPKNVEETAKRLVQEFKVEPLYIIEINKKQYLLSPKVMDYYRVKRLLKEIDALNIAPFLKYKHSIIPYTAQDYQIKEISGREDSKKLSRFHSEIVGKRGVIGKDFGKAFFARIL